MKKILFLVLILGFIPSFSQAESKKFGRWSKEQSYYNQMSNFSPYLEDSRHVQIPQWQHKDWYLEDWFTQEKGIDMVKSFYEADIFRDQFQTKQKPPTDFWSLERYKPYPKINNHVKTLVVGPGFYHLSGFDKRRVVAVLDATYGVTKNNKNAAFVLEDWHSKRLIGVYNQNGLELH